MVQQPEREYPRCIGRGLAPWTVDRVDLLAGGGAGYAAWLKSIVFRAANGARPLLIAAAAFFPVDIVHGIGIWIGGW
jgi:hypothetical protein